MILIYGINKGTLFAGDGLLVKIKGTLILIQPKHTICCADVGIGQDAVENKIVFNAFPVDVDAHYSIFKLQLGLFYKSGF